MPLGTPTVLAATVFVTASPATTAAFTPTGGALVEVVATVTGTAAATGALTTADISSTITGMGTWSLEQRSASGLGSATAVYIFRAFAPASPGSGTVTVTFPTTTPAKASVTVVETTGVDTTTPVAGVATTAQGPYRWEGHREVVRWGGRPVVHGDVAGHHLAGAGVRAVGLDPRDTTLTS